MQFKLFTLPVANAEPCEQELNKFLRSHRVLQVERHFCPDRGGYWSLMVEYMDGDPVAECPPAHRNEKRDFREGLSDEEKKRYDQFKVIRRELAKDKAIPAYLIFTNEELAILAQLPALTEETIRSVKGVAPQRMKDNIAYFMTAESNFEKHGEESGESDAQDSRHQ